MLLKENYCTEINTCQKPDKTRFSTKENCILLQSICVYTENQSSKELKCLMRSFARITNWVDYKSKSRLLSFISSLNVCVYGCSGLTESPETPFTEVLKCKIELIRKNNFYQAFKSWKQVWTSLVSILNTIFENISKSYISTDNVALTWKRDFGSSGNSLSTRWHLINGSLIHRIVSNLILNCKRKPVTIVGRWTNFEVNLQQLERYTLTICLPIRKYPKHKE